MTNVIRHILLAPLIFLLSAVQYMGFAQGRSSTPFVYSYEISSPYVTCFAEDPEGFMWIGTNHGLNRFNGTYYDVHYTYRHDAGLKNDDILDIMIDEAGDVYLLSEAGLSVRRNSRYYHFSQSGFSLIWQIADYDSDYLIVANSRGVDKIRKSDLSLAYHYKSLKIGVPKPISVSGNGCVLMTCEKTEGNDHIVLLDDQMREIGTLNFPKPVSVYKIIRDEDGSNWIIASHAIFHLMSDDLPDPHGEFQEQKVITISNPVYELKTKEKALFVCNYDERYLLAGVQNDGLRLIEKSTQKAERVYESETLPSDNYICYVDSHYNIWISDGKNGFALLPPESNYSHLSFPESRDSNFKRLCFDKKDRLWLRSSADLICFDPETRRHHNFSPKETFYDDIFIDSRGRLWTIEQYTHLKCYEIADDATNPVGAKLLIAKHYDLGESAFTICECAEGRIWVMLADRFVVIEKDGSLSYEEGPFKVNFTSLQSHGESRRMFLHTIGKGIMECNSEGRFQPIGTNIPNSRVVYADSRNNLWIGTSNKGLVCYNEKSRETTSILDNIEVDAIDIKAIEEDIWGNVWFSTSTMVYRYNTQNGNVISIHDIYLRGGNVYNLYASAKDRQGRMYFGGMDGVTTIDPMKVKYQKKRIPIKVEDVIVGGDSLYEYDGKPFKVKYNRNNLVFWFAGLDYSLGKQISYEYKVDGYLDNWRPTPHQQRIALANLPAGNYTLRIRVKTSEEGSSFEQADQLAVPFSVSPAPWFTIWAKLAYLIILLAIAYFSIRHLVRTNVRKERLMQLVADRMEFQRSLQEKKTLAAQIEKNTNDANLNFLNRFHALLNEHLADEDFGVEEMSRAMGIGEAKLYAKVKEITGQTPKAYFVAVRMNKAMELLKSGEYNVSEVGYMVGATSLAVFSRAFKHQFGISPSAVN